MKTVQIYFSLKPEGNDEYSAAGALWHKGEIIGWTRGVLVSDRDVTQAIAMAKPRPGETFVGAVAVE